MFFIPREILSLRLTHLWLLNTHTHTICSEHTHTHDTKMEQCVVIAAVLGSSWGLGVLVKGTSAVDMDIGETAEQQPLDYHSDWLL